MTLSRTLLALPRRLLLATRLPSLSRLLSLFIYDCQWKRHRRTFNVIFRSFSKRSEWKRRKLMGRRAFRLRTCHRYFIHEPTSLWLSSRRFYLCLEKESIWRKILSVVYRRSPRFIIPCSHRSPSRLSLIEKLRVSPAKRRRQRKSNIWIKINDARFAVLHRLIFSSDEEKAEPEHRVIEDAGAKWHNIYSDLLRQRARVFRSFSFRL